MISVITHTKAAYFNRAILQRIFALKLFQVGKILASMKVCSKLQKETEVTQKQHSIALGSPSQVYMPQQDLGLWDKREPILFGRKTYVIQGS